MVAYLGLLIHIKVCFLYPENFGAKLNGREMSHGAWMSHSKEILKMHHFTVSPRGSRMNQCISMPICTAMSHDLGMSHGCHMVQGSPIVQ